MAASTLASASDAVAASRWWDGTIPRNAVHLADNQALLRELTASWHPESTVANRRHSHRIPCEITGTLRPIDEDPPELPETVPVLIANLSKCGVGIVHHQPLPYRLALIEYELASATIVRVLVRLKWCRFKGTDVYESGGQILRVQQETKPGE